MLAELTKGLAEICAFINIDYDTDVTIHYHRRYFNIILKSPKVTLEIKVNREVVYYVIKHAQGVIQSAGPFLYEDFKNEKRVKEVLRQIKSI